MVPSGSCCTRSCRPFVWTRTLAVSPRPSSARDSPIQFGHASALQWLLKKVEVADESSKKNQSGEPAPRHSPATRSRDRPVRVAVRGKATCKRATVVHSPTRPHEKYITPSWCVRPGRSPSCLVTAIVSSDSLRDVSRLVISLLERAGRAQKTTTSHPREPSRQQLRTQSIISQQH